MIPEVESEYELMQEMTDGEGLAMFVAVPK